MSEAIEFGPHEVHIRHEGDHVVASGRYAPHVPGPPPHHHPWDETFSVESGHLIVTVDGVEHVVGPGESAVAPAGAVHTFRTHGDEPAAFIGTFGSPSAGEYLRAMGEAFGSDGRPDPDRMEAVRRRFGVVAL